MERIRGNCFGKALVLLSVDLAIIIEVGKDKEWIRCQTVFEVDEVVEAPPKWREDIQKWEIDWEAKVSFSPQQGEYQTIKGVWYCDKIDKGKGPIFEINEPTEGFVF